MGRIARTGPPGLLALVLMGCGQGAVEPSAALTLEESQPAPPATVASAGAGDEGDYAYNPIGKRDPYRSFLPRERDPQLCVDWADPLQCWAVERLSLRGVVWGEHPRALIETPRGESFVVELGSYVGGNWGKVTHIDREAVVITEEYLVGDGELKVVPHRMELVPAG